jgi:hypothetical protein
MNNKSKKCYFKNKKDTAPSYVFNFITCLFITFDAMKDKVCHKMEPAIHI